MNTFPPLDEAVYSYNKIQGSLCDPTKPAISSNLRRELDLMSNYGENFNNTVSFEDMVHFINEENIVTFVGLICGITIYTGALTKLG